MTEPDPLTTALLKLAALGQQLADLDQREAGDVADLRDRLGTLTALTAGLKGIIADQVQSIDAAARLAQATAGDGDSAAVGYQPAMTPRFWQLDGADREHAITRLRAWVEQIYRPEYGYLSAGLGDCWDQHPLCLYLLDWLSELWSVLYLQPARTPGQLAGQAEWQTRLLTIAVDQLARETRHCRHGTGRPPMPARTARP